MGNNLPKGWEAKKMLDVLDYQGGSQPPKKQFVYEPQKGYVRLLQIRDFGSNPFPTYVPDSKKLKKVKNTDILLARYGGSTSEKDSLGRVCTGLSGAYNVALAKLIFSEKELNRDYVKYLFMGPWFRNVVSKNSRSCQKGFNRDDLKDVVFPIAPIEEQKRIADKLGNLLAKVKDAQSRLDKIPAILGRFRQSVLAAAFSGELTKEWRKGNDTLNAKDDLALIREFILKSEITNREKKTFEEITKTSLATYEEQFNVPSSWVACSVGFIGVVNNGSTPSRKIAKYWNGSIPWISSGEVRNNKINASRERITQEGLDNCSSKLFSAGTVLIAMIGEGKTRGQSAILNIEAAINQNIAAVQIVHGRVNPEYLWYWFQYQYENNRSFGSGSGPQALNCQRVRELPFVFAPKAEQGQIVGKIKSSFNTLDGFIGRYLKSKNYTDKLEQSILAKAFRGELVR